MTDKTDVELGGQRSGLGRRAFMAGAAAVAATAVAGVVPTAEAVPASMRLWSDPATWGGRLPTAGSRLTIKTPILVDRPALARSVDIAPGGALVFDPHRNVTLTLSGNLVVRGLLQMRPSSARVTHLVRFTGIDEARFVGGGMMPLESDVGLWVVDSGRWDAQGAAKTAWIRAAGSLATGQRTVDLAALPGGWQVGDEVTITPTLSPRQKDFSLAYDTALVTAIRGRRVTLDRPLVHAHPAIVAPGGTTVTAEVLNLSRNARVEGTPGGRTHVMVMSMGPQVVKHVGLRYVGPRRATGRTYRLGSKIVPMTEPVMGRYGTHFHMMGDQARGSVLEGVVVRDGGSHAFVPHASHGITYRACISHSTMEEPYWWDPAKDTRTPQVASNDLHWDGCVASLVRTDPPFRGYRLSGFSLGSGTGSRAVGCVAVGVQGNRDASGFHWPEGARGVWSFRSCVSHNNARHGAFVWQNTSLDHRVAQMIALNNGGSGISHGAYLSSFRYQECLLHGNREAAFLCHALSPAKRPLVVTASLISADGAPAAFEVVKHTLSGEGVRIEGCRMVGHARAAVLLDAGRFAPHRVIVRDSSVDGTRLQVEEGCPVGSEVTWLSGSSSVYMNMTIDGLHTTSTSVPAVEVPIWPGQLDVSSMPA
ncbi:MAG: hypothetical protein ACTHQ3_01740 [Motilibacteraceae bacterium]